MDNYDMALHKITRLRESKTLEIRFETFNTFNHAQFFGPNAVNGNIDSATFGYVTQAAFAANFPSGGEIHFLAIGCRMGMVIHHVRREEEP